MNTTNTKVALPAQVIASDATFNGEVIDLQDVEMIVFAVAIGAFVTGDVAVKLQHGDADDLSDAVDVDADDQARGNLYDVAITPSAANRVYRYQLLKFKRYARVVVTTSDSADYSVAATAELMRLRGSLANDQNVA